MGRLAEVDGVAGALLSVHWQVSLCAVVSCEEVYYERWLGVQRWIAWSKWFKKHYGVYPDRMYPHVLAKLSRMSKSERDEIILPELMKMEGL